MDSTIAEKLQQAEAKIAQSELQYQRISANIATAYTACDGKGAIMPSAQNSANLPTAIRSIPEAVQPTLITKQITANGTYAAADDNADGYSDVTVAVPDESKDVLDSLIDRSITTITSNATSIGRHAFSGCTALTEVNFPKVTFIGQNAFQNCTALTEVSFPETTSVEGYAFSGCTALTEVNFPKVTSVNGNAFSGCTALTEVNFPKVTFIGGNAFSGCTGLNYFDMSEVNGVPTIYNNTFKSTTCIFLFRDQTQLDEYASATNWSALADRFQIKGATS